LQERFWFKAQVMDFASLFINLGQSGTVVKLDAKIKVTTVAKPFNEFPFSLSDCEHAAHGVMDYSLTLAR
jgi:hypothetical protein